MLRSSPTYPGALGWTRQAGADDIAQFADWMYAFLDEAVPHDRRPSGQQLKLALGEGRYSFWMVDGQPASMAGIIRLY